MKRSRSLILALFSVGLSAAVTSGQDIPVGDWQVPAFEMGKLGDSSIADPSPFAAISPPCRLYDSRVSSGGPGPIPASGIRSFDFIPGGSPACGSLPGDASALSLYITIVGSLGPGFIYAFPTGSPPATPTSIINYTGAPGELRNNAAIILLNGFGSLTIGTGGAGTDIIIDINGLFYTTLETADAFELVGSAPGGGIISAFNTSTGTNSYGLFGRAADASGSGSAGVRGMANTGASPSVVSGGEFETNSTADGSAGVVANSNATTGRVYGLLGDNDSNGSNSAGVWGRTGGNTVPATSGTVGVLGTSFDSGNIINVGVLGVAQGGIAAQGVYGSRHSGGTSATAGVLGYTGSSGVHSFDNITASGMKSFIEPHPTDPALEIAYVALEGPEAGTYFRGRARVQNGLARIAVPEDFRLVSEDAGLSIQAMPIGEMATFAVMRIDLNEVVVKASRNVEFFYTVNGVRKGRSGFQPIRKNEYFRPASATDEMRDWPAAVRAKLVANGTLTTEGTPNQETAARLGWKALWEKEAAEAKARAEANREKAVKP